MASLVTLGGKFAPANGGAWDELRERHRGVRLLSLPPLSAIEIPANSRKRKKENTQTQTRDPDFFSFSAPCPPATPPSQRPAAAGGARPEAVVSLLGRQELSGALSGANLLCRLSVAGRLPPSPPLPSAWFDPTTASSDAHRRSLFRRQRLNRRLVGAGRFPAHL